MKTRVLVVCLFGARGEPVEPRRDTVGVRLLGSATRALVCLFGVFGAHAQNAAPEPLKLGGVTVSGSVRARVYGWDWFHANTGESTYAHSGNLLRIAFSQAHESWDWTAEFAAPVLLGMPANALGLGANYRAANDGAANAAMIFPKQLHVRFTRLGGSRSNVLKIGRFEFSDGSETAPRSATLAALKRDRINQRLLGSFGWSDVGRSFDGFHYAHAGAKGNFTLIGAVPTRGVFQVDGWGWNRVVFGYTSYTRSWGKGRHAADTRVFALYYNDFRRVAAQPRITTFGGHTVHAIDTRAGALDVILWGAGQTGRWGAQLHRARAIDVEAGLQPKILPGVKPWLRAGYFDGSGDGNPNDRTHGTFFSVLPTPRPFARFPFFNTMNNRDAFGILILRPHAKLTVSGEFHALRLSNANDLWYAGGGVFQPWSFGYTGRATGGRRSLANLYDSSVELRLNRHATFNGYFGYAQGKAAMAALFPRGAGGKFGYLEATYKF